MHKTKRGGAWTPCPCCENFLCTIHGGHAHDCPCPPVEEWTTDPYAMPTLAAALDAERERQGLSLNELARRANQSPGRVHAVLSGGTTNPGIVTVRAILAGLGKSLAWLDRQLS